MKQGDQIWILRVANVTWHKRIDADRDTNEGERGQMYLCLAEVETILEDSPVLCIGESATELLSKLQWYQQKHGRPYAWPGCMVVRDEVDAAARSNGDAKWGR